jgi:hypothetical protein
MSGLGRGSRKRGENHRACSLLHYRAIDQFGQVVDVLVSEKRNLAATRRFFTRALEHGRRPTEVSTDRAPAYPRVLDELLPATCHVMEQYANNAIEADHGRLKLRLRPMRGLKRLRSARVNQCRARVHAEPPPRPLRHRHPYRPQPPTPSGVRRTRPRPLIHGTDPRSSLTTLSQRNTALWNPDAPDATAGPTA